MTGESVPSGHLLRQRITVTGGEQNVCRGILTSLIGDRRRQPAGQVVVSGGALPLVVVGQQVVAEVVTVVAPHGVDLVPHRRRRAWPASVPGRQHQAGRTPAGPARRPGTMPARPGRSPGEPVARQPEDGPVQAVAVEEGLQDGQPDGVPVEGDRLLVTRSTARPAARLRAGALASVPAQALCP